jgi:trimethylamine---corrinoid protein Co-methyltransferase
MQMGHEKTLTALTTALAGANAIYGAGMLESGMGVSYQQLVADDEMYGAIKRVLRGIEVNDETLGVEVIEKTGPRGHFLGEAHTRQYMKTEHFYPDTLGRMSHEKWTEAGSKDFATRAKEKALKILESHEPIPLPEDVRLKIRKIMEKTEKALDTGAN